MCQIDLDPNTAAGYDVPAYMSTFSALEKDQILGKLVLLYSTHDNIAVDNPGMYSLPRLVLNRLFLSEKVPHVVKKLAPLATGPFSSVTSNGGLISPQSPARSVGRPIDPSLVSLLLSCLGSDVSTCSSAVAFTQAYVFLYYFNMPSDQQGTENPPPCNEHYLMACSKGVRDICCH